MSDMDNAARIVRRLRQAADELDSARRFGLPIPTTVSVTGHELLAGLGLSFDTDEEFDGWVEYATAPVIREYDYDDAHWRSAEAGLGLDGLRVTFAVSAPLEAVAEKVPGRTA